MVAGGLRDFRRFCIVGAAGFVVDAGLFLGLLAAGADAYVARAASVLVAVTATWWLNKEWTFRPEGGSAKQGTYLAYLAVQSGGMVVNYAVFAGVQSLVPAGVLPSLFALMCGAAVALVVNFAGARGVVFRP
jgi:putative flippase GtrA